MKMKLVHGSKIAFTSDWIDKDIIRYERISDHGEVKSHYASIVKVVPKIDSLGLLSLNFVMSDGAFISYYEIKELIRKYYP